MNPRRPRPLLFLIALLPALLLGLLLGLPLAPELAPALALAAEETTSFGRFGKVTIYRPTPHPGRVVLFVSGDGGWNQGVVDMARELSALDALVVGVDITHYLKALRGSHEACSYPAGDFEALSQYLQKKLDFPRYTVPVLVGYSSGATLVYATLVQAPPNTFRGAIGLGFCPDLPLTRPLCKGEGLEWTAGPKGKGFSFLPAKHLEAPWIALQGTIDQVCDPGATEAFVKQVPGGKIVVLPKVGHGYAVPRNWMPQFRSAFGRVAATPGPERTSASGPVSDLPLVEVPAKGAEGDTLAVILSGDGGWASIDKEMGDTLSQDGIPVVGLNSLQYFWKQRTPDGMGMDLERILRHYLQAWHKEKALLIGYSRGADVLPFAAARQPADLLDRVPAIALLGPSRAVAFKFHVTDWLTSGNGKSALPVRPEVEKLRGRKILCFYGIEEKDSLCRDLGPDQARVYALRGAHHFGGDYREIAHMILTDAKP